METFLLYQHFRPMPDPPGGPLRQAHFWLHFLLQSCQPFLTASPQGSQSLVRLLGAGGGGSVGEGGEVQDGTKPLLADL